MGKTGEVIDTSVFLATSLYLQNNILTQIQLYSIVASLLQSLHEWWGSCLMMKCDLFPISSSVNSIGWSLIVSHVFEKKWKQFSDFLFFHDCVLSSPKCTSLSILATA